MHSSEEIKKTEHDHFQGKDPLEHVVEAQIEGIEASLEVHGAETPGMQFSFLDTARETTVAIGLLAVAVGFFEISNENLIAMASAWGISWSFWKAGRSTWISWMRLERLHRIAREEQHELETNREQEREELKVLYRAKGFEGALLNDVVDVLMADQERLLRVMLQEEMGFRLNENKHPLFMGLGAFLGGIMMTIIGVLEIALLPLTVIVVLSVLFCFLFGLIYAYYERNNILKAGCWSAMVAAVCFTFLSTIMDIFIN